MATPKKKPARGRPKGSVNPNSKRQQGDNQRHVSPRVAFHLPQDELDAIKVVADKMFDGNISKAIRALIIIGIGD